MENFMLFVSEYEQKDELYYEQTPILRYAVKYPQFSTPGISHFVGRLNAYYRKEAEVMVERCQGEYYEAAVSNYRASQAADFPFHEHDFCAAYTITNNRNCVLSLYTDKSRYTGGANGSTWRTADNWNLSGECPLDLAELFSGTLQYRDCLLREIDWQIAWQISRGEADYFEDYRQRTERFFEAANFYVAQYDLNVFFQEITIAPHSSGIVTFAIPFTPGPIYPRVCNENSRTVMY